MSKIDPVLLFGERVYLREMKKEDAPYIVSWRNDPDIKKWMFNQNDITIEEHLKWFAEYKKNRKDYIICIRQKNKPIGTVSFTDIVGNSAEVGKMIGDKKYWGGGYAKEAFLIWLNIGFKIWDFYSITAKTMSNNVKNIELNKRIGFRNYDAYMTEIGSGLICEVTEMIITRSKFYEKNKE